MTKSLSESVLFSGLDDEHMRLVEQAAQKVSVDKGAFLFFQDDPADRFYVVLSGKVKIFKSSPDGKEQILLMAGPGDSFGEAALFSTKSYPAAAEVAESGELAYFTFKRFMALVHENPTVAVNMVARLSMLLHHLTRLVQRLSLEDVVTRLAEYILDLLPDDRAAEQTIVLDEKKMVLASILGTIPETLSRAFAGLSKSGVLSIDGQTIVVHDRNRLTEIAAGEKIGPA
jgi:CRP-like cAMP-binding protein